MASEDFTAETTAEIPKESEKRRREGSKKINKTVIGRSQVFLSLSRQNDVGT